MEYIASVRCVATGEVRDIWGDYPNKQIFGAYLRSNGWYVQFITTPEGYQESYQRYCAKLVRQRCTAGCNRRGRLTATQRQLGRRTRMPYGYRRRYW